VCNNPLRPKLLLQISTLWSKLKLQKIFNLQSSKAATREQDLRKKSNTKHYKIMCWSELDTGFGILESAIKFNP